MTMIAAKAFLLLTLVLPAGAAELPGLDRARAETGLTPLTASWLPEGYSFKSLDILPYHGRKIIHYRYSDGVHVLSLFQCPPRLRLDFGSKDREKVRVDGGKGFFSKNAEGNVLGWSVKGARLVLVGSFALEELEKIAESVR